MDQFGLLPVESALILSKLK
uniref:Uncharacterized protein n=1 Tax=Moniliophthora roreri TaxID=221103 RepID=A0A0W0GF51_MONRR